MQLSSVHQQSLRCCCTEPQTGLEIESENGDFHVIDVTDQSALESVNVSQNNAQ